MARTKPKPPELRDFGTPEIKRQHLVVIEGTGDPHARITDQDPLDGYYSRGFLAPQNRKRNRILFAAGDRLRGDWFLAGLSPKTTSDLLRMAPGKGDWTARQLDARERLTSAYRGTGPMLWRILVHIVCQGGTAESWARRHGCPARDRGLPALRLALDALAEHYGL